MNSLRELKVSRSAPGRPLYLAVRDALREAINTGVFPPGQRMPSTQELSEQLDVSLVTTHKAMQELVVSGVVRRSQGKGTFIHEDAHQRVRVAHSIRVSVVMHPEASLADFHHSQVIQGVRMAARQAGVDLFLPRFDDDVRNECRGYLLISPQPRQIDAICDRSKGCAVLVGGAIPPDRDIGWVKVDNHRMAREGLDHLCSLRHERIGYVGADDNAACGQERWEGFVAGCRQYGCVPREEHIVRSLNTQADDREQMALVRMLSSDNRPTAIFAAGFGFAMDVYHAARAVGLSIPGQLSVIAIDDPMGAGLLSPPLTTFRRPLIELGQAALTALLAMIQNESTKPVKQVLTAGLIIRGSTCQAHGNIARG